MNALFAYLILGFLAIVFCFGALLFSIFYHVVPSTSTSQSFLSQIYGWVFLFFDNSFLVLMFIFIGFGLIQAYVEPNIGAGFLAIILILCFAFLFISLKTTFLGVENGLTMSTFLPRTYAIINSNWTTLFIIISLAVECVFDFRK